jgi:hypothetical protein
MTRNEWIGLGIAGVTLAAIGVIVVVSEKKASASQMPPTPAVAMNNAIAANGLRKVDMPIYEAFQTSAGLATIDGFPGPTTIGALTTALNQQGQTLSPRALNPANNKPYPWAPGVGCAGYDGTNAPLASQWDPTGVC